MTINYYLDKPQDGVKPALQKETSLYLFLRGKGKTLRFNTGQKLLPRHWDSKAQKVKTSFTGSPEFNSFLTSLKADVQTKLLSLASSGQVLTMEEVKGPIEALVGGKDLRETGPDFEEAYALFLENYGATRRVGTVQKYKTILSHLRKYATHKKQTIRFGSIDLAFYESWTGYLMKEAMLTNNSVGKLVRLLKTFMHWATERGYNTRLDYKKFKPSALEKEVQVVALTEDELFRIYQLDLSQQPYLSRVRDVFCFGCFTGQRFSDVAALKPEHVRDGVWHLHVKKTSEGNQIPLNDFALEILKRYEGKSLPAISNQKSNTYLKKVGKLADLNDPITITRYRGAERLDRSEPKYMFIGTHTARRTFVTLSLEKGMRPEIVMSITGHRDYKSFKKYIRLTDKVKGAEMKAIWSNNSMKVA